MIDLRLALMCGTDIPIPECELTLHQPRIREIALIGEKDFYSGAQCLCISKNMFIEDNSLLGNSNNFQIFMTVMSEKEAADKKAATLQLLTLLFPGKKINFTPRSIIISGDSKTIMLDERNFEPLQAAISSVCCLKTSPMDQQTFNPANKQAKIIADKLMRGRKRVAEQKGESNSSVLSQYVSMLTIGVSSMSLEDVMNLTIYQIYDLIERYNLYINWDLDIKSRLAGANPDSKPDNWMKNIH